MHKVIFDIEEKLKAKNYKLTSCREHILRVLLENKDRHLSAREVYNTVKEKAVGLATVYRTLELFCNFDIIHGMDFGDGHKRYEFGNHSIGRHHLHLICLKCGAILEVEENLVDDLEARAKRAFNFEVQNDLLKVFGLCKDCKK